MVDTKETKPLGSQRHLFDIPRSISYFNGAYMAPLLKCARRAGQDGVTRKSAPWCVQSSDFFEDSEIVRSLFAQIIAAKPDDVAIIPSVSYGMELAASNLRVKPGQRILVLAGQFPSNVYPWQRKAKESQARLDTINRKDGESWTDAIVRALDAQVAIVAISEVHEIDGSLVDLARVSLACKAVKAALVLDLTHSVGVRSVDLRSIDADAVVVSGYTWLLGPHGQAYVVVPERHHTWRPIECHWMARQGSEDFVRLATYSDVYRVGARRFDYGGLANFILMPMAREALSQILAWGPERIERAIAPRGHMVRTILADAGLRVESSATSASHLIGARGAGDASSLCEHLASKQIFTSVIGDVLRVSVYLNNDNEDISRLGQALHAKQVGCVKSSQRVA